MYKIVPSDHLEPLISRDRRQLNSQELKSMHHLPKSVASVDARKFSGLSVYCCKVAKRPHLAVKVVRTMCTVIKEG